MGFKILMASDIYFPLVGGISEHIHNLTNELRKRGHDVFILTSRIRDGHIPFEDPPHVIRIGRGITVPVNKSFASITFSPLITRKIKKILDEGGYDIVHIHGTLAPTIPLVTLYYTQTMTFFTFHASHGESKGYELFKPILQKAFDRIDGLIAVSEEAKNTIARYFPGNYRIIPNGVDVERFKPDGNVIRGLKSRNTKVILFVGRFEPRKGVKYLIKAMRRVLKEIPDARLVLVGGGPLRKFYTQLVEEEIKDKVHFAGIVPREKLPAYYRSADVFVSPAIEGESFGIVLLEAMASGLPVIASRIPGYTHVFKEGDEGFFFKPKDHKDLAEKLIVLLKNDELRREMGRKGRERVVKLYSWAKVAGEVESYYNEVIKEKLGHEVSGRWV